MNKTLEQAATVPLRRERGLDRAMLVLDYLREVRVPQRPNEIARGMGGPRSSIYDAVASLIEHGILDPADEEGRVYLGRKLYFLGAAWSERFDAMQAVDAALRQLTEETSETAQFCGLEGNKYVVIRMREGSRPFRISSDIGHPVPIPWTASGRVLLVHLTDAAILDLIPPGDFQLPDGTWLDPAVFLSQVRDAEREGGFTFDSIVDSFTRCFAVPVPGGPGAGPAGTVCLIAPREDGLAKSDRYLDSLRRAATGLAGLV